MSNLIYFSLMTAESKVALKNINNPNAYPIKPNLQLIKQFGIADNHFEEFILEVRQNEV